MNRLGFLAALVIALAPIEGRAGICRMLTARVKSFHPGTIVVETRARPYIELIGGRLSEEDRRLLKKNLKKRVTLCVPLNAIDE